MGEECEGASGGVSGDSLDEDAVGISDTEYRIQNMGYRKDVERLKIKGLRLQVMEGGLALHRAR